MMVRQTLLAGIAGVLLSAAFPDDAGAQSSTAPQRNDPVAPSETRPAPTPENAPAAPNDPSSGQALSDELSRSGGVLQAPRQVDPQMTQPPPPTGPQSMPEIAPPGTPGGDPNVRPK